MQPTRVTSAQLPKICRMLNAAFADDPMLVWPIEGVSDLPAAQLRLWELIDVPLVDLGLLWTLTGSSGLCAAAWIPPDHMDAYLDIDAQSRSAVQKIAPDGGKRWEGMWDWIEERLPQDPVWFLDHVGVAPEAQGRGLGRRLIEHGIAMAQEQGLGTFLETAVQNNVTYYEKLGFQVTTDGEVPDGGPRIWFMYRPPA